MCEMEIAIPLTIRRLYSFKKMRLASTSKLFADRSTPNVIVCLVLMDMVNSFDQELMVCLFLSQINKVGFHIRYLIPQAKSKIYINKLWYGRNWECDREIFVL